jgi:hypothetical protein
MTPSTNNTKILHIAPLWRPQKVSWIFPYDADRPIIDQIKSKSTRKFLRSVDQKIADEGIRIEYESCSREDFNEWLTLYVARSIEKNFRIVASIEWFEQKKIEGRRVERIFAYRGDTLIGGKIITVDQDGVVRSAFKTSVPLESWSAHNASLGIALDYLYLREYAVRRPTLMTAGSSQNLFGVLNSVGYLVFKLRIGYLPEVAPQNENFAQSFEVPTDRDTYFFLSEDDSMDSKVSLYCHKSQAETKSKYDEISSYFPVTSIPIAVEPK